MWQDVRIQILAFVLDKPNAYIQETHNCRWLLPPLPAYCPLSHKHKLFLHKCAHLSFYLFMLLETMQEGGCPILGIIVF